MDDTIIDSLYKQIVEVFSYFEEKSEISFNSMLNENLRKNLLLSAGSYFENQVMTIIETLVTKHSNNNDLIVSFLKNKALARQYYTFFEWRKSNANKFFSLFGDKFKSFMENEIKSDPELKESIKAFMELGEMRNNLVHQNFANFPMEKDTKEIYQQYKLAYKFVLSIRDKFIKFLEINKANCQMEP